MEPLLDIIEGFIVSHIIDDNDTVSTSVVGRGNGAETLLSSSIPNLELDCLAVKLNCADFLLKVAKIFGMKKVLCEQQWNE
jgi:hypothetical protein